MYIPFQSQVIVVTLLLAECFASELIFLQHQQLGYGYKKVDLCQIVFLKI